MPVFTPVGSKTVAGITTDFTTFVDVQFSADAAFTMLPNGRVLVRDAGFAQFNATFDAATDEFLGGTHRPVHGPHPILDSDGAAFCEAVALKAELDLARLYDWLANSPAADDSCAIVESLSQPQSPHNDGETA